MTDDEKIARATDMLARLTRKLNAVENFLIGGHRHDAVSYYTRAPRPAIRSRPSLPPLGFYHH